MQQHIAITSVLSETAAKIQNCGPALMRSALLPAILMATASHLYQYFESELLVRAILSLSMPIWMTLYMVPVMRGVLIGENAIGRKWGLRWGRAETRVLLRCLILYAVPIAMIMVLVPLAYWLVPPSYRDTFTSHSGMQLLAVINMVFMFYVLARLTLMLPAAAIGDTANPKQAWQLSHSNGWRMLGLYVLLNLILGVLIWLLSFVLLLLDHPMMYWVIGLVSALFEVVGVVAIAVVYRELSSTMGPKETMATSSDLVDTTNQ